MRKNDINAAGQAVLDKFKDKIYSKYPKTFLKRGDKLDYWDARDYAQKGIFWGAEFEILDPDSDNPKYVCYLRGSSIYANVRNEDDDSLVRSSVEIVKFVVWFGEEYNYFNLTLRDGTELNSSTRNGIYYLEILSPVIGNIAASLGAPKHENDKMAIEMTNQLPIDILSNPTYQMLENMGSVSFPGFERNTTIQRSQSFTEFFSANTFGRASRTYVTSWSNGFGVPKVVRFKLGSYILPRDAYYVNTYMTVKVLTAPKYQGYVFYPGCSENTDMSSRKYSAASSAEWSGSWVLQPGQSISIQTEVNATGRLAAIDYVTCYFTEEVFAF